MFRGHLAFTALRPGDSLTILPMASSMGSRVLASLHCHAAARQGPGSELTPIPDVLEAEALPDALVERTGLRLVEGVEPRQHRMGMFDGAKRFEAGAPTRCVGESGVTSSGCFASRS